MSSGLHRRMPLQQPFATASQHICYYSAVQALCWSVVGALRGLPLAHACCVCNACKLECQFNPHSTTSSHMYTMIGRLWLIVSAVTKIPGPWVAWLAGQASVPRRLNYMWLIAHGDDTRLFVGTEAHVRTHELIAVIMLTSVLC